MVILEGIFTASSEVSSSHNNRAAAGSDNTFIKGNTMVIMGTLPAIMSDRISVSLTLLSF